VAAGVRVDKWLWAVRLFKTRTAASKACDKGLVSVGDEPAKPARRVSPGDRVTVERSDHTTVVEVVKLLEKRVGAPVAATAYVDHSPSYERPSAQAGTLFAVRDRGAGRPTKRDRREIDRLRGRRD
jgi:ribosome-associated heat shock protein Hsp15